MNSQAATDHVFISSSGNLLAIAKRAYQRCLAENGSNTPALDAPMTAVLLSCASLEGYINEAYEVIRNGPGMSTCPDRVKAFADILQEAEASRGSTRLKYQMGLAMLTGKSFDKGTSPYQDFELLFSIRDTLMHHKMERISGEPHKLVKSLCSKGLCEMDERVKQSWHGIVFTPATAKWAINTAVDMMNAIREALIACESQDGKATLLKFWFGYRFQRIEEREK